MSSQNINVYVDSPALREKHHKEQKRNYISLSLTGFFFGIAATLFTITHFINFGYSGIDSNELGIILNNGEKNIFYPVPKEQNASLVKKRTFNEDGTSTLTKKIIIPSGNRIVFIKKTTPKMENFNNCSVTNISHHHALTSAHCGEVGEKVYVYVKQKDGEEKRFPIGKITKSLEDRGIDAAIIKYYKRAEPEVDKINTDYSSLQVGDALTYNGATSSGSHGRILKIPPLPPEPPYNVEKGIDNRKTLVISDALVQPGDSGGPIYNSKGEVIGLIKLRDSSGTNKFVSMAEIYRAEKEFFDNLEK